MGAPHPVADHFSSIGSFAKTLFPFVFFLGGIGLIGYFYDEMLADFMDSDLRFLYAGLAAFFNILGFNKIVHGFVGQRTMVRAIRRAVAKRPPKDGDVCLFIGALKPDGDTLTAPFSGEACIQYEYSLTEHIPGNRNNAARDEVRFAGFHLCPAHIQTVWGPVALNAYPPSSGFVSSTDPVSQKSLTRDAWDFVARTRFEDGQGFNYALQAGSVISQLSGGAEPPIALDISFTHRKGAHLTIHEEFVPPGVGVSLLAKYDAKRRAAVWCRGMEMLPLDREALQKAATAGWHRGVVWGVIFMLLGLGLAALPLGPSSVLKRLGTPGQSMLDSRERHLWSAIKADGIPLTWRIVNRLEPDATDDHGRTLLMSVPYDPVITRQLLEAGADPNIVDDYGETALQKAHNLDVTKVLLEYGADASLGVTRKAAYHFVRSIRLRDIETVRLFLKQGMTHEVWHGFGSDPLAVALIDCEQGAKDRIEEIIQAILDEGSYIEHREAYNLESLGHAYRRCHLAMDRHLFR